MDKECIRSADGNLYSVGRWTRNARPYFHFDCPLSVLSASDGFHAGNRAELGADVVQLADASDAEGQGDQASAAGQTAAGDLADLDLHAAEGCCNVQHHVVAVLHIQLQRGGEGLIRQRDGPAGLDPAIRLLSDQLRMGIDTVAAMDGHAEALGHEAHNGIAGNRRAAAGKLDQARADVLHDDAGIGGDVGLLQLQHLGRGAFLAFGTAGAEQVVLDPVEHHHHGEGAQPGRP